MAPIAIVGMACLFPGAADLEGFWRNIVDGVDAISDVPPERWDARFYDPESRAVDRFYCRRGGFVDRDASFDPLAFGIVPNTVESIEPDQLLALKVGFEALRDAGYDRKAFARERSGVIIGRGNYLSAGVLRLEQHVRLLPQIVQTLRDLFPDLGEEAVAAVQERLQREIPRYGPDVAAGLIPNLTASRLANRFDLHGPAFTVDAACASAVIALEQACASLERGETDMMLVGGVHLTHDLTFWATFSQLGALSRSGVSRPLSAEADGILAGEGIGMAVLRRLDDARRDGDRVYATIEGIGSSSDGRSSSLVAPAREGQLIALRKAWEQAPFEPDAVGLLETHGTGTPTGDQVELETLAAFFGPATPTAKRAVAGSVKSMIGHAMPASAMASLIKMALSIHHGVLPPTLHCERPHPQLASTRFRVIGSTEPWRQAPEQRVAALNAFGFGGINGHVILRGVAESAATVHASVRAPAPTLPGLLMLSAEDPAQLLARFDRGENDVVAGKGRCRLVIVAPDAKKLAMARKAIVSGKPWRGQKQIWFSPDGLVASGGKVAFVFPGVDSRFEPRAQDLALQMGLDLPPYCETYDPASALPRVVRGLLAFNLFMFDVLGRAGIHADGMAGHSLGEWSALVASGIADRDEAVARYANIDPDRLAFPDLPYLAASCDAARLTEFLHGLDGIVVSHDNCPHQAIACGERPAVEVALARLQQARIFAQILPMVAGFHSPLFAPYAGEYADTMAAHRMAEPTVPVWSIVSGERFPADEAQKRSLVFRQMLEPVRFRPLIESMYEAGFRVFVQVGTGSLTGFIGDTLNGRPHLAVESNSENRSGLEQLQLLSAALWVEGYACDPAAILPAATRPQVASKGPGEIRLALGVPLLRVREPLEPGLLPASLAGGPSVRMPPAAANDSVGRLLHETMAEIESAGREVLALWQRHRAGEPAASLSGINLHIQRLLDVDRTVPMVRDHAFFQQREGWPILSDRRPVIPLTMEVMLVREALEEGLAARGMADLKVIEVSNIKAYNWLDVSAPVTIDITIEAAGGGRFNAEIAGYFSAELTVAAAYPEAEQQLAGPSPLRHPHPSRTSASELYTGGWMFHGPAYRGVRRFHAIGDNGIDGELVVPQGSGSLLDNMGQLAGYWVMEQPVNCLAMPIGVDRIRFFGPDAQPGEVMQAQVRVTRLDDANCMTDHVLWDAEGRIRVAMEGWQTRRFPMDEEFWLHCRRIGADGLSRIVPSSVAVFEDRYESALMRDYIARRYLTASERAAYDTLPPRRKRQWLNGRVAAKDAVRAFLRQHRGISEIFPQELCIENSETGAPFVRANVSDTVPETLHISLSHKDSYAVAIVGERPVGIDLEKIEPRTQGFADLTFSEQERALLGEEPFEIACARGWVAKEAVAKARGTGLGGNPLRFVIDRRDGDCFGVNGHWVVTHRLGDYIVGWLLDFPGPAAADSEETSSDSPTGSAPLRA